MILALTAALLVALAVRWWRNPVYVSDPQPQHPPRASELADRIDPNTADWQTLAALPMIGEKRAREIIAYRERFAAENAGQPAFRRLEDLMRIHGFGYAITAQLEPYLIFPSPESPATSSPVRE